MVNHWMVNESVVVLKMFDSLLCSNLVNSSTILVNNNHAVLIVFFLNTF